MKNTFPVQITAHPQKSHWYVARYRSAFLGATYSVEFANTVTGAVALYHFVQMLQTRYPGGEATCMLPPDAGHHPVPAVRDAFSMQGT
jgi:hypothetical protein